MSFDSAAARCYYGFPMNMSSPSTPARGPALMRTPDDGAIRAVLFDFDGTLVFHRPDSLDLIRTVCAEFDHPLDDEAQRRIRRARHEYFVDPLIRDRLARLSTAEFWHHLNRHLLTMCGLEANPSLAAQAGPSLDALAGQVSARAAETSFHYHCPVEACQTLAALRARGYDLGLVTNRGNVDRFSELLDQTGLRSYFDVTLASGEVGVSKPEPEIFHHALELLGTTAGVSLYVGDNYWADVVGAQRAGLTPVLFDPHRLFPEAECLVLERLDGLLAFLCGETS